MSNNLISIVEEVLRKNGSVVLEVSGTNDKEVVATHLVDDIKKSTNYSAEAITDGVNYHVVVSQSESSAGGNDYAKM
jgi:hypothetical protein